MPGCPSKPHPLHAGRALGSLKCLPPVRLGPPTLQPGSFLLLDIPAPWGPGAHGDGAGCRGQRSGCVKVTACGGEFPVSA